MAWNIMEYSHKTDLFLLQLDEIPSLLGNKRIRIETVEVLLKDPREE